MWKLLLVTIAPPATAAPASAISAISPATATTAATAFCLGARFIDIDRATPDRRSIKSRNRLLTIFIAGHLDESETAGAPRVSIGHDAHSIHLPERFKQLTEFVFVGVEAQVPHENILHASASALSCRKCEQFGGLGRSGGPFLKIETGAGEQSNAASSIAGFLKRTCQFDLKVRMRLPPRRASTRPLSNSPRNEIPFAADGFSDRVVFRNLDR
jgi:hypothetical protein